MRARLALALAIGVNGALLLGCAAMQNLQTSAFGTPTPAKGLTPTPAPTATPVATVVAASSTATASATATPASAAIGDRFTKMGDELTSGFKAAGDRIDERGEAPRKAIDAITAEQERAVGQAAAINIINQSGGLVLEEGLVRYVNGVANFVASKGARTVKSKDKGKARINARRFFVGILDSDDMNAFALPGGYILITRGLVENLSTESDLAWVLGHEIAHVDNEDGLGALKVAIGTKEFMTQWTGTSGDSRFDNPAFFEWIADKLANIVYKVGLDHEKELAADKQGLEYATRAGYDSRCAKRVLELLAVNSATAAPKFHLYSSHDPPARRLAILGDLVEKQPKGKLGFDRFDLGAIQRIEAAKNSSSSVTP